MKKDSLNSGLIAAFRFFVAIRVVVGVLAFIAQSQLLIDRFRMVETFAWLGLVDALFLLVYLSWPWLRERLGDYYLPIALAIAIAGPVIEYYLSIFIEPATEINAIRALAGQWEIVIVLLIPIILISWEYGYRVAVVANLGLAVVDLAFYLLSNLPNSILSRPFPLLGVVIFRTLTFLLISYIIVRLSSELRKRNIELEQANIRLVNYTTTLERLTLSRERNRMARELHDTLAHSLSAVAVQLEAVSALWDSDPKKAHEMLQGSLDITRNGLNEARHAIQALRIAPLEDLGLGLAVKNLATTTSERAGLSLDLHIADELPPLSKDGEFALYRIAEEALRNAVEHAAATKVTLRLEPSNGCLMMEVRDNGQGFDTNQIPQEDRFGLRGMQERAEAVGAELEVRSQPSHGTSVMLKMERANDPDINL